MDCSTDFDVVRVKAINDYCVCSGSWDHADVKNLVVDVCVNGAGLYDANVVDTRDGKIVHSLKGVKP